MRLVICDDEPRDLDELERLLLNYGSCRFGVRFEIEKFSDASALLHKIQKNEIAEIYILDIVMSRMTGIDLGSQIRKNNSRSALIYVTASDDFAMDAYNVHAIRYLLKPVAENKLFEALDYALSRMESRKDAYPVKIKGGLESVLYTDIEYIENASRKLEVHLTNGKTITSINIRTSFEEATKELIPAGNFLYVHKSFLINMDHVRTLNQNTAVMDSGANIPVSRKSSPDAQKEYLLYISEQHK